MILSWLFFFHRKMRPMKENAPQGSHCGGMVECRLRAPPQAENPVEQDSLSLSAVTVVCQHTGTGVIDITALPALVGHPEVRHHPCLSGIILFKDFPIQQAILCEGLCKIIFLTERFVFLVGVILLCVFF